MARAGFGGGSDYSGLFGSLYTANKAANQSRQDAEDQDAQDKWEHGLITDAEWLQYITDRVASETDPKRKERWVTAQREYVPAIADKQAEFAYQNGGSIGELLTHYQTRLAQLVPGSNEYREVALKVNDIQDARSSERLQEQADAMVEQINRGTKTYGDLLGLLNSARGQSTPNSDYRKSVDKQISQVKEQIRTNKLEGSFEKLQYDYDRGALSAGSYASKLRSMAGQFKDSDPKRYYQILEAAVALGKAGGSGGGGGGGRGSGGGSGSSAAKKAAAKSIDSLQANRNRLQGIVKAYESGATSYVGADGVAHPLTQDFVAHVDRELVKTFDALTTAYKIKGDKSAAANQAKAKATYIAKSVVLHNTIAADETSRHLLNATSEQVRDALDNPDPVAARSSLQGVASQWETYTEALTQNVMAANGGRPMHGQLESEVRSTTPKGIMDKVDPDFVARSAAMASAFRTVTTSGVDDASAAAALAAIASLQGAGGGKTDGGQQDSTLSSLLAGALEVNARVQGLETGDLDRVAVDGAIEWVRKTEISHMVPDPNNPSNMLMVKTKVPTNQTLSGKSLDVDGKKTSYVTVVIDINGKPTPVKAIAEKTDIAGFEALKTKKDITLQDGRKIYAGTTLTTSQVALLTKDFPIDQWLASGKVSAESAIDAWQVKVPAYTDKYGQQHTPETWIQDSATNLWYKGQLPIRGIVRDENGFVKVGDDGRPMIDYKAYASAAGVPSPYAGADPKGAQVLLDTGVIDVSGIRGRDINGNVTDDLPAGLDQTYYSPLEGKEKDDEVSSWWRPDTRSSRSTALVAADREATYAARQSLYAAEHGLAPVGDASPDAAIRRLAASTGIHLDGTPSKPKFNVFAGKEADDRIVKAPSAATPASAAPVVKLASGMDLANELRLEHLNITLPKPTPAKAPVVKAPTKPKPKPKPEKHASTAAAYVKPAAPKVAPRDTHGVGHGALEY